jgi:hypothetical protein
MLDIFEGRGAPLTVAGVNDAIQQLGADEASLWALVEVETRGFGYLPDRRPQILFERHIFHDRSAGEFSSSYPDISNPTAGGYKGGAAEYDRLKRAMLLDRQSALESASWGLGQVMGFNAEKIGYADVDTMIEEFKDSEDAQLAGAAAYITANEALHQAFQDRNWSRVAFFYNGKNYAAKGYHTKLAATYATYSSGTATPDLDVRAAQARLTYLGFKPRGVDGVVGPGTIAAVRVFQAAHNLDVTGNLDAVTEQALRQAAGV